MTSSDCPKFIDIPSRLDGKETAPTLEPLDPSDIVEHARIDGADESNLIKSYISAAREFVENEVKLSLGQRTVVLYMDAFPEWEIEVRFPPLQSVTSITYYDGSGGTTTLDSSLYRVATHRRPGLITPVYGAVWPPWPWSYPVTEAVTITAVVGYTSPTLVPACAKQAIRYLAAMMYQDREPMKEDYAIVRRMLDPIRWDGST